MGRGFDDDARTAGPAEKRHETARSWAEPVRECRFDRRYVAQHVQADRQVMRKQIPDRVDLVVGHRPAKPVEPESDHLADLTALGIPRDAFDAAVVAPFVHDEDAIRCGAGKQLCCGEIGSQRLFDKKRNVARQKRSEAPRHGCCLAWRQQRLRLREDRPSSTRSDRLRLPRRGRAIFRPAPYR